MHQSYVAESNAKWYQALGNVHVLLVRYCTNDKQKKACANDLIHENCARGYVRLGVGAKNAHGRVQGTMIVDRFSIHHIRQNRPYEGTQVLGEEVVQHLIPGELVDRCQAQSDGRIDVSSYCWVIKSRLHSTGCRKTNHCHPRLT